MGCRGRLVLCCMELTRITNKDRLGLNRMSSRAVCGAWIDRVLVVDAMADGEFLYNPVTHRRRVAEIGLWVV